MSKTAPSLVRLANYRPPQWLVDEVHLTFHLDPLRTRVRSRIAFRPGTEGHCETLELDGEELTLISARIDGADVSPEITPTGLRVTVPGRPFVWEAEVEIAPRRNTALEGLYMSGNIFCTQCEAEGFRRITYYPDRPDVMAPFTVRIECAMPVMLSNGNPVASGPGWAEWHDPWPKPSYLFALVAGDLKSVSTDFTTREGRHVALNIWVRPGDEDRCDYALDSLIRAMTWDENVYALAYDLDVFNLVAVDEFNAGAMENKGLNIFNSKYVLASPETATDGDYEGIEAVVAHEYFHNWTGNRITCRDWFQLCLKEGLTVFRDQQFTADMRSAPVKRIADVMLLRAAQFREDNGPLAHPPRPDTYSEINNFYTTTVYEKGAEIVRMLQTILGEARFKKGLAGYFGRHDGQAATVEDFFACFEALAGSELAGFAHWWTQAGTPHVTVARHWDGDALTLDIEQRVPPTPGESVKRALPIPLRIAVLSPDGSSVSAERLFTLREVKERWVYTPATEDWKMADPAETLGPERERTGPAPIPSINRGFSAPIVLDAGIATHEARSILARDTDPFNRWDAGRRLMKETFVKLVVADETPQVAVLDAFRQVLVSDALDPAFKALTLRLPSDDDIAGDIARAGGTPDPAAIHKARQRLRLALAQHLHTDLAKAFSALAPDGPYRPDAMGSGRRALRLTTLSLLTRGDGAERAEVLFRTTDNMTERLGALVSLLDAGAADDALQAFYADWKDTPGVLDKWFALQVSGAGPDSAVGIAEALTEHPAFDWRVPNRVRAVAGALIRNHAGFHAATGAGYGALSAWICRLDRTNPQIAAGLTGAFQTWRRYDGDRQGMMQDALDRIAALDGLSRDTAEMVARLKAV